MEEAPRSVRVLLKSGREQTFPNAVYQVDFRTGWLIVYQLVGQRKRASDGHATKALGVVGC